MTMAAAFRKSLLLLPTVALAQQLTITVLLREPLPGEISTWRNDPTIVRIVVSSSAPTPEYPNARIGFELREFPSRRLLARSKDGHPRQPQLYIPKGPMTVMFTGPEILHEDAIEIVATDIREQVAATGTLPEGTYEFCVRLLDAQLHPIAATGNLCRTASVVLPDPPILLTPADGSQLSSSAPLLSWTPVQPAPGPVRYRLRIVPIYSGQDRRSAIERNSPVYETELPGTSLLYPSTAPPFALYPDAIGFAWQVQALLPDGRPAARNQGKSQIFVFSLPATPPTAEGEPGTPAGTPPGTPPPSFRPSGGTPPDTIITRVALPGGFILQLETAIRCTTAPCTLSGRGKVYIPFLRDSIEFSFTNIVVLPGSANTASLVSGVLQSSQVRNLPLWSLPTAANHVLRILEWEFSAMAARVRARAVIDWSGTITCRATDSVELGWQPIERDGLPPIRLRLPVAWECDGNGLLTGPCFSARFDSIGLYARYDTIGLPPRLTGWFEVTGELTITCLTPPPSGRFVLRLDRGGADLLVTVLFRGRTVQLPRTPAQIRLDTAVLDLSSIHNAPRFPPAGLCPQSDWGNPAWRGLWIPGLTLSIPIESDTLHVYARNVIAEDVGGSLKLSLNVQMPPHDTVSFAGFRVRLDDLQIRWCRGAFQDFSLQGLLLLPPTLSKPTGWAQLDSLRLRLTCDANWNWVGTLDIFGAIQLDFGSYARLILHNGRIAKVTPSGPRRGYVEFTTIRLQAPPENSSSYVEFSGLRIWNNGDVELESAEGWVNVSRWAHLTIAGITVEVQEVGLGYHQPSGSCSDAQKHWWVGFSGGVSIDDASGLPGGGSGVRVRRLRIYDNLCMQSEGAGINITVSGAFALRGELLWGTIQYGSGSGTVTTSGILGQLSAAFYALGGLETQVDFALGSVITGTPYRFWFVQGTAAVPGGVPIVPGVFHLVGGIVGAGWHVQLDTINRNCISETSGIVPPPPLVPDPAQTLLLRGGLIFADPSLQLYRLPATVSVSFGSTLVLILDGKIRVLPTVRLAEGTAYANISLPGGNLRGATISLSGNVNVNLLGTSFNSGFSANLNSDCFWLNLWTRWTLVDLDVDIGNNLLGAEVVAKAYTSLDYLRLRLCPTSAEFSGSFSGAGVVGVKLNFFGAHVPFHFGLSFSAELCGYYLFKFSRSGADFVTETKLGGALGLSVNADYSGWWSGSWKGTQAYDHISPNYCGSGNWVDLSRHWNNCRENNSCSGGVQDCKGASIELRARGVLYARLQVQKTCFTDASGRQVCLPRWHSSSLSIEYGYYGYGKCGDREGAKKGGSRADEAQNLSCASLANERSSWAKQNAQQQQPPALIVWSTPGRGQTGVPIDQPLRLQLGAPVNAWSSGGVGTCQWQLRSLNCRLYEVLPGGGLRDVRINVSSRGDSVVIRPERHQGSGVYVITTLMPNTRYWLIISGEWWAQCPGSSASSRGMACDTIEFTTGAPSGWRFWVTRIPDGRFRDTAMPFTPPGIALWVVDTTLLLPLEFGRDLWLRIRDSRGRMWEWRGSTGGLIQSAEPQTGVFGYVGHLLYWDTLQLQPIVVLLTPPDGPPVAYLLANLLEFTILNAKKSGSTASRPDTAHRLLDALPVEIDRWTWTRVPSAAEYSLSLFTQLSWRRSLPLHEEGTITLPLRLLNAGRKTIFAGTPFTIIVRKNIGGTVTEERRLLVLPHAIAAGGNYDFTVGIPSEPGLEGLSVWVIPRSPFSESILNDNCVEHGIPGDASCTPGTGIPLIQEP